MIEKMIKLIKGEKYNQRVLDSIIAKTPPDKLFNALDKYFWELDAASDDRLNAKFEKEYLSGNNTADNAEWNRLEQELKNIGEIV